MRWLNFLWISILFPSMIQCVTCTQILQWNRSIKFFSFSETNLPSSFLILKNQVILFSETTKINWVNSEFDIPFIFIYISIFHFSISLIITLNSDDRRISRVPVRGRTREGSIGPKPIKLPWQTDQTSSALT